jgi:release factor glutamine methyltransferase
MRLEKYLRSGAARLVDSDTAHLDMRLFAKAALGLSDAELILAGERSLSAAEMARLEGMVRRRLRGESAAHIVGEKEFYGLSFKLASGILSPRPDTELLVEAARRRFDAAAGLRVLDLGVGSGAVLCALLTVFPQATGVGVDMRFGAAALARDNARRLGLRSRASFFCGDFAEAAAGRFDLIVSNPPYIPLRDLAGLAPEVRLFEDELALAGGVDGLDAYRRILPAAARLIAPGGLIALEFGHGQEADLARLAAKFFRAETLTIEKDLAGRPRALVIDG